MKSYGLLGEKLSHSYSPTIHNLIFESLNLDASYSLLECKEEDLEYYIAELKKGKYQGFNVTIPYKKKIISYLDDIDDKAKKIGSVNTVYLKDGKAYGTNTDYDGFLETLNHYKIDVFNKECFILGTGGASFAVYQVLKDLKGICHFVSRTPKDEILSYQELENKQIDILVNTTPVGMFPDIDVSPVTKSIASKAKVVIDIIFNPQETQLLKDADSKINGLYMLLMQALKAEEIWQKQEINISISELLEKLQWIMSLPSEIFSFVQQLKFQKDNIGRSGDSVYVFEDKYILKISKSKEVLLREKERIDWLEDKILGSKSIAFQEANSMYYYLRTYVSGDSLISKRFLKDPIRLIKTIKKVVDILRKLDHMDCPFKSTDNLGNSFVHGDLCLPNIYVNQEDEFVGFIDLDNSGLGDAWYDYAWLLWSFEYNLKTDKYTGILLKELNLKMDENKYYKYISEDHINELKKEIHN